MKSLIASALLSVLPFVDRPASACWDGFSAGTENVSILQAGDSDWHAGTARKLAEWLPRIGGLLPSGTRLESDQGFVSVYPLAGGPAIAETRWTNGDLPTLFDAVVRVTPGARARVNAGRAVTPLTVQVLAVSKRDQAERFAKELNERNSSEGLDVSPGFYSAGGFPSLHPIAHVLDTETDALWRVVVGAYLDGPSAQTAVSSLRSRSGRSRSSLGSDLDLRRRDASSTSFACRVISHLARS